MRVVATRQVGETRAAVLDGDRAIELHVERWSERGARAQRKEVYRARVKRIEPGLNGAFCDLGRGPEGFLPFGKARPEGLHEGGAIGVQVSREAFQEKGPTLSLFEVEPGPAPEIIHAAPPLEERLSMAFDAPVRSEKEAGVSLDALFEAALSAVAPIPGGGRLIIEPTAALTAIDVDAAGRKSTSIGAKFALDLNRSAAKEAARQIRLRGIGGVVAIDFVALKKRADQKTLEQTLAAAFARDPAKVDIAPASRFAIVELARQRVTRSLREQLLDRSGCMTDETAALQALRRLEAEGRAQGGAQLILACGAGAASWLEADPIGWRKAMTQRLGARFTLRLDPSLDVHACQVETP
ncbi:MAG: ribonuclease E/G [Pseudomonadota bacterium]